jgi:malate dehydrogenase (oxaloacetate-decarboxylating)/malate dehydrogenase (oxaloacetate-decarboxylating)(NADP+)
MGLKKENILLVDRVGLITTDREGMGDIKAVFAMKTDKKTLADAMHGADVFIGVASANLVTQDMVKSMADKPIVFALSNPDPEISPADAHACRDDLIMGTGRSDYPNQVNNVLGFPFIFRGALDAKSKEINVEMKIAAVHALSSLAKLEVPQSVLDAYNVESLEFGKDYIIPKPFDPRLIDTVPKAIFDAAVASGVSRLT